MSRPAAREFPASRELEQLLDLFATGDRPPHPDSPTPAAAIVLVRDTPGGLQIFVTRQSDLRGNVDRNRWSFPAAELTLADLRRLPLAGWSAQKCAAVLRMSDASRAVCCFTAAARAGLTTTGILLAEDTDGRAVATSDAPLWADSREDLTRHEVTFPQMLEDRNLRFRPDLLHPWMRWINTRWQLRRFDTVYFIAALPPVQQVEFRSPNESWGGWVTPAEVLAATEPESSEFISVATRLVCESLSEMPTVGSAMASVRDLSPRVPEVVRRDDGWWVQLSPQADPSGPGRLRPGVLDETDSEEEVPSLVAEPESSDIVEEAE